MASQRKTKQRLNTITIAILVLLVVLAFAFYSKEKKSHQNDLVKLQKLDRQVGSLERRLKFKQLQVAAIRKRNAELSSKSFKESSNQVSEQTVGSKRTEPTKESDGEEAGEKKMPAWYSRSQLKKVDRYIVTTPEEKEKLKDLLQTYMQGGLSNTKAFTDLEAILGPKRAFELLDAEAQTQLAEQTRTIENDTIILARRLSLSDKQETQVKEVLAEAMGEFDSRPPLTDKDRYHEDGSLKSPSELLKELYQEKNEILYPLMKDVLNDKQYNDFIEYRESHEFSFVP